MIYFVVGLAGVIGSLLRYYLGLSIHSWWITSFPLATLMINYLGSFTLGWFNERITQSYSVPEWLRLGFGTGLIGSFTTFSTFSVETMTLMNQGLWEMAFVYVLLSMVGGLLFAYFGFRVAYFQLRKSKEGMETA
ncbi:fluoride efflux transporter CrcB [Tepidibacillus infernus]|uniref:Fluoride-specific ion channel FluC n=1 Tax=Tepidibacillus decaturensis TaxID=1413211 RepID=A0A135L587_9BACI|nr:fluoride efflux transporter CrcB [Tepidibacillus decaturensis]KXG44100.1 camphor resistance protein CrcB [Tepidibacillus decaturensis]